MAEGDIVIYNNFKEQLALSASRRQVGDGTSVKITLHTGYTPDIDAHQVWGDTGVSSTEYGSGSGYTADTKTLANKAVTQNNTNDRMEFDADNVAWTSLGPLSPATPSHAIIRENSTGILICYIVLGTTATNGGDYTIAFSTSPSAILTLT